MVRKSKTHIATPPGATIKEQLEDKGMSQKEFAARMAMSEKHISKLINGEVQLTSEVAMKLEMVLGTPARFWNNLESIYREKLLLVRTENEMEPDILIAEKIPYKEMEKYGWVPEAKRIEDRVRVLRKYFELIRLTMLNDPLVPGIACQKEAEKTDADFALLAWAQKAKIEARNIVTKPIDYLKLEKNLPEIRSMTSENPTAFTARLSELLAECGIALVFLPFIGGRFLHGATFIDKNKIVIGLTVDGKYADQFWFNLFHELAHILKGHINNAGGTAEGDEKEADSFAKEILIPSDEFTAFTAQKVFTAESLKVFAEKEGIDVGIIVERLQEERYIQNNGFNELKTKYVLSA